MPVLHFNTDQGRATLNNLRQVVVALQDEMQVAHSAVGSLVGEGWRALAADQFWAAMDEWQQRFSVAMGEIEQLNQLLDAEILQWEEMAARFGGADRIAAEIEPGIRAARAGLGLVGLGVLVGETARSASSRSSEQQSTDRRVDRRIESDERWGRSAGGDRGDSHFSNDWAGRAILERYVTGGSDWYINDDSRWTEYMQNNETLTANLRDRVLDTAQELWNGEQQQVSIDETFPMEIENGEGIVGYQYLHGTNANVGGFQRQGTATMSPDGNGGSVVTLDLKYTWNDIVDPNPDYVTDSVKSRIAEVVTLGKADPYEMHISWHETTTVHLDANGNPISIENP